MNGKKARAIRRQHGIKHARLARPRIVREEPKRERLFKISPIPIMAISKKHLAKLREHGKEHEGATGKVKEAGSPVRRHRGRKEDQG